KLGQVLRDFAWGARDVYGVDQNSGAASCGWRERVFGDSTFGYRTAGGIKKNHAATVELAGVGVGLVHVRLPDAVVRLVVRQQLPLGVQEADELLLVPNGHIRP